MPTVTRFSITPIRGFGLLHPDHIDLTEAGVVEDRRFYLIDETDRLIDRMLVGELVQIGAWTDPDATRLRLEFPDGAIVDDEVRLGAPIETYIYDRTAVGHVVEGPWVERLAAFTDRQIRLIRCAEPAGTRLGLPTSLVSDASVRELARQAGVEGVDARRFRMLIEVTADEPHEEDGWIGRRIEVGDAVLGVVRQCARCVITTQDPETGVRDLDTLRTIIGYRGLRDGKKVDFGVLADVVRPGRVCLGDEVRPLD